MTGHRAPRRPSGRSERADAGPALAAVVGEADEVLERPVQMTPHGAVQVERDRDEGEHEVSVELLSSPPGAALLGA